MTSTRHVAETDMRPWFNYTLDIADCERVEFCIGLLPGEKAGMRPETWPGHARTTLNVAVERWLGEKNISAVRAITYGAVKAAGAITLAIVIHYEAAKAEQASTGGPTAATATGEGDTVAMQNPADFVSPPACLREGCGG